MRLPLEGITIIDSAHQYPGPYCTQMLSDLGADVIKIEPPGLGDAARMLPPFFNTLNRNKKSVQLNLKTEEGVAVLKRLIKSADVFVEGFRPGVCKRLGIDFSVLSRINDQLIYCSISGYGQDGPYKYLPGHDLNYQAMAGMLQMLKDENGNCIAPRISIADLSSGMFAVVGIMAALMARQHSGKGQFLDVSMFDGLISWMGIPLGLFHHARPKNGRTEAKNRQREPGSGVFFTKDGKQISLNIAYEDWFWKDLCRVMKIDRYKDLSSPERQVLHEEITRCLKDTFKTKTSNEWCDAFKNANVPIAPVQELDEVINDPHVKARNIIEIKKLGEDESVLQVKFPVKFSDLSPKDATFISKIGEHGPDVLEEIGYSESETKSLRDRNII